MLYFSLTLIVDLSIGFTGDKCQTNINDCMGISCPAGTVCVDLVNRYECTAEADLCSRDNLCKNGATCFEDHAATLGYSCFCPNGYKGKWIVCVSLWTSVKYVKVI